MKKISYLLAALILPGLVFVFLKYQGKNEFEIPIYYEDGLAAIEGCFMPDLKGPYVLPDSLWKLTQTRMEANVLAFGAEPKEASKWQSSLDDELGAGTTWVRSASEFIADTVQRRQWERCIFRVKRPFHAVLYDLKGRIRGYYDPSHRDEMDRLRVELKILLKRY